MHIPVESLFFYPDSTHIHVSCYFNTEILRKQQITVQCNCNEYTMLIWTVQLDTQISISNQLFDVDNHPHTSNAQAWLMFYFISVHSSIVRPSLWSCTWHYSPDNLKTPFSMVLYAWLIKGILNNYAYSKQSIFYLRKNEVGNYNSNYPLLLQQSTGTLREIRLNL